MSIEQILIALGLNISSNVIYDIVKNYFKKSSSPSLEGLKNDVISQLQIKNADIKAEKIIEFLAQNGDIIISGTSIYASDKIELSSSKHTSFIFGKNSKSETKKTKIETKGNSQIIGKGRAKIVQDKDGNIKFQT